MVFGHDEAELIRDAKNTVQGDLATADDALMQMGVALFHGDATTLMSARTAFLAATSALTDDLQS